VKALRVLLLALALLGCKGAEQGKVEVTLAAAASLRRVLPALMDAYAKEHPDVTLRAAYGASGDLRKRVQDGAPIDAVLFASGKPVDELIEGGQVNADSRKIVAKNELVLIAPKDAKIALTFQNLDELPDGEKLAIGEPAAVPAGQYAVDALKKLGKWEALQKRVVYGGDVAAVLAYARRGEVAAAIVYHTEILGIDGVKLLDRAKGEWAPTPEVVVGVVKTGEHGTQAKAFLEFMTTPAAQKILEEHGFLLP
jgi:molybdate transport system substrate-binding protein